MKHKFEFIIHEINTDNGMIVDREQITIYNNETAEYLKDIIKLKMLAETQQRSR